MARPIVKFATPAGSPPTDRHCVQAGRLPRSPLPPAWGRLRRNRSPPRRAGRLDEDVQRAGPGHEGQRQAKQAFRPVLHDAAPEATVIRRRPLGARLHIDEQARDVRVRAGYHDGSLARTAEQAENPFGAGATICRSMSTRRDIRMRTRAKRSRPCRRRRRRRREVPVAAGPLTRPLSEVSLQLRCPLHAELMGVGPEPFRESRRGRGGPDTRRFERSPSTSSGVSTTSPTTGPVTLPRSPGDRAPVLFVSSPLEAAVAARPATAAACSGASPEAVLAGPHQAAAVASVRTRLAVPVASQRAPDPRPRRAPPTPSLRPRVLRASRASAHVGRATRSARSRRRARGTARTASPPRPLRAPTSPWGAAAPGAPRRHTQRWPAMTGRRHSISRST
jgi:hypothetical protein